MICLLRHADPGECSASRTAVETNDVSDVVIGVLSGLTPICTNHFGSFKRDYLGKMISRIELENAIREAEDG